MSHEKRNAPGWSTEGIPNNTGETANLNRDSTRADRPADAQFSDVSEDGLTYAEDMRRRREASRRLPVLPSGVRDPFGGSR